MEHLHTVCDWIILLAATGTAIYKLIDFVAKPTSKIKQKRKNDIKEALKEVVPGYIENYSKQTFPLINYYGNKVSEIGVHGKDAPMEETLAKVFTKLED